MKTVSSPSTYVFFLLLLIFSLSVIPLSADAANMEDYCLVPPYVKRDVKPNIMIIMDNSFDMLGPAYCTASGVTGSGAINCTDTYSPSGTPTGPYEGYFVANLKYRYDGNKWVPDSTAHLSGNLLNWVSTSKYDLLQKILVGGISTSRQTNVNNLIGKTGSWEKRLSYTDSTGTARVCLFQVNNGNITIKDVATNSCGYLDATPKPIVVDPAPPLVILFDKTIEYSFRDEIQKSDSDFKKLILKKTLGAVSNLIGLFASDAEAAKPISISGGPSRLTDGTVCTDYSVSISASGGTEPYSWGVGAGSPPGLNLTSGTPSATISGQPTAAGTYDFTVTITDAVGGTDSKAYQIVVSATSALTITTGSALSTATEGSLYSTNIFASGGACGGFTWSLVAGSMPAGLSLGPAGTPSTTLSGTPAAGSAGFYNFTVKVKDGAGRETTKGFTLEVIAPPAGVLITTASPLPDAMQNALYSAALSVSGGTGPYSWSITSGALPAGLILNPVTGLISGTPTATGPFVFTVRVADSLGIVSTKEFSLTVSAAPIIIRSSTANIRVCTGDYTVNCITPDTVAPYEPPCSQSDTTRCVLKSGIVDEFWPQARFGIMDFRKVAGNAIPTIENCIEQNPGTTPDSNFLTAIENAVPIDPATTLVNSAFTAMNYYANNNEANCNPFANSQPCLKNFNLFITSGVGADNPPNPSGGIPSVLTDLTHCDPAVNTNVTSNMAKNTCFGYENDLRNSPVLGVDNLPGRQYVTTYIVNPMGVNGVILKKAADAGGGVYYPVDNAADLKQQLRQAFQDILKRASAGTAASVLASGEGSGANLIQAVFYPRRKFEDAELQWIGRLSNFWYFVDPFFGSSSIYEDSANSGTLDISGDNQIRLYYDPINEQTRAERAVDTNADGTVDSTLSPDIAFENLNALWEAGTKLWERDLSTDPRTIKTSTGGGLINFSTANKAALRPYLNSATDAEAEGIIRYMHGEDTPFNPAIAGYNPSFRGRKASISGVGPKVWKLGDVLNSTPKISSWIPLNTYHLMYRDDTYGVPGVDPKQADAPDATHYITSSAYKNRSLVFAGANDGMLHAFKLGTLELEWGGQGQHEKARLTGADLGKEIWAFIPKNVLPYLKYIPEPGYCHIYSVDFTPYIFDASINKPAGCAAANYWDCDKTVESWRSILIGGMRYGGACRGTATVCNDVSGDGAKDCVNTPVDVGGSSLGYSSYFALDITDEANPVLLWEFSHNQLGFTTTGPSVVKINTKISDTNSDGVLNGEDDSDTNKNGKWFVVFGSGPTGPISTTDQQFMGRSDQNLRLFVIELKSGAMATASPIDTGINYAFAGSILNATDDLDKDYQDDILYIGYVKRTGANPNYTWTDGGIGRLVTKEDLNPNNWVWSKVIDNIGPVTSSVVRLTHKRKGLHWLFFGAGRYYFEQLTTIDDAAGQRKIFGMKEPCYSLSGFDTSCTTTQVIGNLTNVTDIANVPTNPDDAAFKGWYINLDAAGNFTYLESGNPITRTYSAERVITDPLAVSTGLVFFTSYKPYTDVCAFGGKSFIWATKYDTGGAPGALLKGQALLQVSTGSIEQLSLDSAFTEGGGRKTSALEGVPPTAQGLSILTTPPPVKRILHMRER